MNLRSNLKMAGSINSRKLRFNKKCSVRIRRFLKLDFELIISKKNDGVFMPEIRLDLCVL